MAITTKIEGEAGGVAATTAYVLRALIDEVAGRDDAHKRSMFIQHLNLAVLRSLPTDHMDRTAREASDEMMAIMFSTLK